MTATHTLLLEPEEHFPAPGFANTVLSEWTKLRTLRSTLVTLAVTAVLVIGLSALIAVALVNARHPGAGIYTNPVGDIQAGWGFGLLAFIVLGVLTVSNEYSSGMISSTFLATPRRAKVLLAKVLVFAAVVFVVSEVMSFINFYVSSPIISTDSKFPHVALTDHNVLRAVIGMGITATLTGLMGLALGALLRHTAGGITAGVAIVFVGPIIVAILPSSWGNPTQEYWPTLAARQLEEVTRQAHALSAWWGTGEMALFVALLFLVAGYLLVKRDA